MNYNNKALNWKYVEVSEKIQKKDERIESWYENKIYNLGKSKVYSVYFTI